MKKCPFCSEEVQDSAKKCRHCGEWLNKVMDSQELIYKDSSEGVAISNNQNNEQEKLEKLSGIGGWLILPFLGLFYSIYSILNQIKDNVTSRGDVLERYTYLIDLSIIFNIIIGSLAVYSLVLFFKKSKQLPKIYTIFLIVNFIIAVLSAYIIESSGLTIDRSVYDPGKEVGRGVVGLIVWGLYFQKSRRVKNTFIN